MGRGKYHCNRCREIFDIVEVSENSELTCPRCYSKDLEEHYACSIEIGPPPWEYRCQECRTRFQITAPRGPDEADSIRCPACRSKNIKWQALVSGACPPGG